MTDAFSALGKKIMIRSGIVLYWINLCKPFWPFVEHVKWKLYPDAMVSRQEKSLHVYQPGLLESSPVWLARTRHCRYNLQTFIHTERYFNTTSSRLFHLKLISSQFEVDSQEWDTGAGSLKSLITQVADS